LDAGLEDTVMQGNLQHEKTLKSYPTTSLSICSITGRTGNPQTKILLFTKVLIAPQEIRNGPRLAWT